MKRIAISGTWKGATGKMLHDVEKVVLVELQKGNCIVTGGALGIDYAATQVALDNGFVEKGKLELYLPIFLEEFVAHYYKRSTEGVITFEQAKMVSSQLIQVARENPNCVFDKTKYTLANVESYYARNTTIIKRCDILYAFQANKSEGTGDAIQKARDLGKIVYVKEYLVE